MGENIETTQELEMLKARFINFLNENLQNDAKIYETVSQRLNRIKSDIDLKQSKKCQAPIKEQEKINKDLGEFDYKNSPAWDLIKGRGWQNLSKCELLLIARVMSAYTHIPIDREPKRRKPVLVKWFNDHLEQTKECFNCITIH